jgi:hypothetical protein
LPSSPLPSSMTLVAVELSGVPIAGVLFIIHNVFYTV